MTEINPITPANTQAPLVYYAAQKRLIPCPELAVTGFTLLALPNFYSLAVAIVIRLVPLSQIQWILVAMSIFSLLLTIAGVTTVLHAFRNSPVRRNWLHHSLLAVLAGNFLLSFAGILTFVIVRPSGSPAIVAGMIDAALIELSHTAFTILWLIFLWVLAGSMRAPVLRTVTPLLLLPRTLVSWLSAILSISRSLASMGPVGSPRPLSLNLLSKVAALGGLLALPVAALAIWYAIAVYRFSRKERSLIAAA